jgi:hypothetical protein
MQVDPSLTDATLVTSVSFLLVRAWFLWLWAIYTLAADEAANAGRWSGAYLVAPLTLLMCDLFIRHQAIVGVWVLRTKVLTIVIRSRCQTRHPSVG